MLKRAEQMVEGSSSRTFKSRRLEQEKPPRYYIKVPPPETRYPRTPAGIVKMFSEACGAQETEIMGTSRTYHVMWARQLILFFLWKVFGMSYAQAAGFFEQEAKVAEHGMSKIKKLMKENPELNETLEKLLTHLESPTHSS